MAKEQSPAVRQSPAAEPSIWERIDRPTKSPRTTLSHGSIAAAAVEVADAEGLDAVSMRKLSGHLGVTTMALYRYVANKDELVELMIDRAFAVYDNPELPGETWRDVMRAHARAIRAIALAHPWIGEAAAQQVVTLTPHVMATMERLLASLDELGLDVDDMYAAVYAVMAYTRGAMDDEVGHIELMKRRNWDSGDDLRDAYGPHMTWLLGTGRYPAFRKYAFAAQRKDDFEWHFRFGLECVLDGIAARLGI